MPSSTLRPITMRDAGVVSASVSPRSVASCGVMQLSYQKRSSDARETLQCQRISVEAQHGLLFGVQARFSSTASRHDNPQTVLA